MNETGGSRSDADRDPVRPVRTDDEQDLDRVGFDNFALKRQLAERERELETLRSSTSWRMTEPLRRLSSLVRAWRQRVSAAPDRIDFQIGREQYQAWLQAYSTVDEPMRRKLAGALDGLSARPRISVIMPSYNVGERWLRAAILSVQHQIYPDWELCISDDASTLGGTRELLQHYASSDPRIRLSFRATRGHISLNSNSALDLATGDYVALMDADDVIPEDALFWFAREIALHPDVDLLFSDEDKIDEEGRRFDPYFKPAWNPALMWSQNAFCHLGVLRRSLVERVGRFRAGYEGSQDHDLVLRCAEQSSPDRIRHIPRVLYHWRSLAGSTASGLLSKPYAARAGFLTLSSDLRRRGIDADVEPAGQAFYQVIYRPTARPLVSIVLCAPGSADAARERIASLRSKTRYDNYEIVLVTDGPGTGSTEVDLAAAGVPVHLVACNDMSNRAVARNRGAEQAQGEVVCFLDADVQPLTDAWLAQLVARVGLDDVAIAAPLVCVSGAQGGGILLGGAGAVVPALFRLLPGQGGYFGRPVLEQDFSAVGGACFAVKRSAFRDVGGLDADLTSDLCDVDLCLRIRQSGARIVWTPAVRVTSRTPRTNMRSEREIAAMQSRWGLLLEADPAYNPNLSLDPAHLFELATPPRTSFAGDEDLQRSVSRTQVPGGDARS